MQLPSTAALFCSPPTLHCVKSLWSATYPSYIDEDESVAGQNKVSLVPKSPKFLPLTAAVYSRLDWDLTSAAWRSGLMLDSSQGEGPRSQPGCSCRSCGKFCATSCPRICHRTSVTTLWAPSCHPHSWQRAACWAEEDSTTSGGGSNGTMNLNTVM